VDPSALRAVRDALIEIGRRMWINGFVAANDGNLSCRIGHERYLATAAGSIKGFLSEDDLVVIDAEGRTIPSAGRPGSGNRPPSSEIRMHLAIYEARPDVAAVVHAHPPTATGFAAAGVPMDLCVLPEVVATLGAVPSVSYATPSTAALADAVRAHVARGNACLLANHGAVAYAEDPFTAYYHLERVEHFARILLTARLLGGVQVMSGGQVSRLLSAVGRPAGAIPGRVWGADIVPADRAIRLPSAIDDELPE
jgi:L-fuculose-phosphate aldolase